MLDASSQRRAEQGYRFGLRLEERGEVIAVGDGIAWIDGLPSAQMDEVLRFDDGSAGLVFQLDARRLGVILLSQTHRLTAGMGAHRSGRRLSIVAGPGLTGRVVDPVGTPLDGLAPIAAGTPMPLEAPAPTILERDFVGEPLYTGNKIVDTMIPIGKGQRQLLIGDDGVGKSALALDVVVNQRGRNVLCVVVLVGQTRASVAATMDTLRRAGALDYTIVVMAEANALPGLRYLAPFAGCAVAEYWMRRGRDTLVVYDDLTRHAQSYRELSLLLQRPPGREAYPSDVFYLHARLLERSTVLAAASGGGSMTALPIVETRLGEISAYIPTNLISITDGQVYFDAKLFAAGFLPAIDIGRSVSRIGGKAQAGAIKRAAARIRLDYLQFLELELFARFGTKLEASVEDTLRRGRLLRELLKQDRLSPVSEREQLAWLLAYGEGLLDTAAPGQVAAALPRLFAAVAAHRLDFDTPKDAWIEALRAALGDAH
jgi:F-type H+-transporting ATPase subunit alpha